MGGGGGGLLETLTLGLIKTPEPETPKEPKEVTETEAERQSKARKKADRAKAAAVGAFGHGDTNVTGGKLGAPSASQKGTKSLLGT